MPTLSDIIDRTPAEPWSAGGKIPWHEPEFSARMLREHLSQDHDRASRRSATIDRQVDWLHDRVCDRRPSRVLDLGCGPGFYTSRLAKLGHDCVGVDFSPASIEYARAQADRERLRCEYRLEDVRSADLGGGFALVLLVFGELNAFRPEEVRGLLGRARRALRPGGWVVVEAHTEAFVRSVGESGPSWYTAERSVFLDAPHLTLRECAWHPAQRASTERYFAIPLSGDPVDCYVSTLQAYSEVEYQTQLQEVGFDGIDRRETFSGTDAEREAGLSVWIARNPDG